MTSRAGTPTVIQVALMMAAVSCAVAGSAVSVAAQQTSAVTRGFVAFDGGLQTSPGDFSDSQVFSLFVEEGRFENVYEGAGSLVFDARAAGRVWRHLAIGGGVSLFNSDVDARVSARLPHPFFFNQPRNVSGVAEGLARSETAVHIQVMWIAPVNDRLDVAVFGGPTFFSVKQDLVEGIEFSQVFPFDTAQFAGVTAVEASQSTVGFNVGVDVGFYFSEYVGLGGLVRFSRATVDFGLPAGGVVPADLGGLQTTGGLRVRF